MDSKIPLPTDNIYKFLALFGLVVMVSSMTLLIYTNQTTNQKLWDSAEALYDLDTSKDPHKEERIKQELKKVEIITSDKTFFRYSLAIVFGIGGLISWKGFWKWHKEIQPLHDEMLLLQKEKLQLEVDALKKTND